MTPPNGVVGVLGAGRLGLLHIVALREQYERQQKEGKDTAIKTIVAIVRSSSQRKRRPEVSITFGADQELCGTTMEDESCDTVFECTGNPDGFLEAMRLSKRSIKDSIALTLSFTRLHMHVAHNINLKRR